MPEQPKITKVTILIEMGDSLFTIEVPRATEVDWDVQSREEVDPRTYMGFNTRPVIERVTLSMKPLVDEQGVAFTQKVQEKERE